VTPLRLRWTWKRFEALSLDELYDALALRCRVFILEQGPYQDPDGLDQVSWHLLGYDETGVLQAYLRVVDPGTKFSEPSMGRVITSPEVRGTGAGRLLVAEGVRRIDETWPGQANRISAQLHLSKFYQAFGFQEVGEPYGEDRIPHVEMVRAAEFGHPPPLMPGAGAPGARQAQPVPRTGCVQALSPGSGCARTSSLTSLRGVPEPSGSQRRGGAA
jgi:ElaA protein